MEISSKHNYENAFMPMNIYQNSKSLPILLKLKDKNAVFLHLGDITVFKIFIWGGISVDILSEI